MNNPLVPLDRAKAAATAGLDDAGANGGSIPPQGSTYDEIASGLVTLADCDGEFKLNWRVLGNALDYLGGLEITKRPAPGQIWSHGPESVVFQWPDRFETITVNDIITQSRTQYAKSV